VPGIRDAAGSRAAVQAPARGVNRFTSPHDRAAVCMRPRASLLSSWLDGCPLFPKQPSQKISTAIIGWAIECSHDLQSRRAKGGGGAVLALGLLVVLPVLYVGSVGPAYWLVVDSDGWVDLSLWDTMNRVYAPLWWLADQWPAFHSILESYTGNLNGPGEPTRGFTGSRSGPAGVPKT
jgi:hypothetical protein